MKPKFGTIGLIVFLGAGLGAYWLITKRGDSPVSRTESAKATTLVSVRIGAIKQLTLHRHITGYGTVAPAPATARQPAADAPLAPCTAGVVAEVNVAEAELVRKGEVLMSLDSGSTTAAYAKEEVARQKQLYAEHNTSLKKLQNAEAKLALLHVTSPLSGTVVSLNVKPGAAVDVKTVVAEVMDLKRLVVKTAVPEWEADELKVDEPVRVLCRPPVSAKLSFVSPTVNTADGTVSAWAALPANSGLRPGRYVGLRIVTATHANCLAVPQESVVTHENGKSVISLVRGNEAVQVPVRIGLSENGWVEVKGAGLKAGSTVVTVGAYGLPKKTRIRVVK